MDVGRFDCTTEVLVFKVTPQPQGPAIKSLVNIYTLNAEHFEDQAIKLKKLFFKYHAKCIAIDANGVKTSAPFFSDKDDKPFELLEA